MAVTNCSAAAAVQFDVRRSINDARKYNLHTSPVDDNADAAKCTVSFLRPPPTMHGPFAIIYADCTNNNEHRYRCIFWNSEFGGVNSYCTRKVAYYKVYGLCCEMEGEQMYLVFNNSTLYYVLCSSAGQ